MKLELKHLTPYLPYKLKAIFMHPTIEHQKTGFINSVYNLNNDVKFSLDYGDDEHIWMFKPILRPLSDLPKEIEIGENIFTPSDELIKEDDFLEFNKDTGFLIDTYDNVIYKNHLSMPWYIIIKLFEWHFDVFGLIKKGLAININELNK